MLSRSPPPHDIKPSQVRVALDGREGDLVTRDSVMPTQRVVGANATLFVL